MSSLVKRKEDGEQLRLFREYPFTYDESKYILVKPEPKKSIVDERIFPTGKDHGRGASQLMATYANHILADEQKPKLQPLAKKEFFTQAFNDGDFDHKLESVELEAVPFQSQIFRQRSLFPSNTKDQKKFFLLLTEKLKRNDPSIVRLRLAGMNVNDFVLGQLCNGLIRNRWVQIVLLHNNKITDNGVEVLCQALQYHPRCHSIWLASNRITDGGIRYLAELMHWNSNIKELNVSNRWPSEIWGKKEYEMHPHVTYAGAEFLARYLRKGAGLTSLSLADQRIRDDGASILFELLPDYPLRSLNLSGNMLGDRCCKSLKKVLPQNPILEELILSKNNITSDGAIDIAYGLSYNSLITILDLAHNKITDSGLYALYKCLQYNSTIRSLITLGNIHNTRQQQLGNGVSMAKTLSNKTLISHKPFSSGNDEDSVDYEDSNYQNEEEFDEENHGRYDLHAEALAAKRNRNSMIAHHPGNPIDGEAPNRHASFAILTSIQEEATTHASASNSLALVSPPTMRELRASLSLPTTMEQNDQNEDTLQPLTKQPFSPNSSPNAKRDVSPQRFGASNSSGQHHHLAAADAESSIHYRPPNHSFDAMIASPFTRRSVMIQEQHQELHSSSSPPPAGNSPGKLSRSPSIVSIASKRRGSAATAKMMAPTPLISVPGVSAHGTKGLTRASTTVYTAVASVSDRAAGNLPLSKPDFRPATAPDTSAKTSGGPLAVVSIEEAIAQAIRNVNEAPSPVGTPRSIGHLTAQNSTTDNLKPYHHLPTHASPPKQVLQNHSNDDGARDGDANGDGDEDDHSVQSAISRLSLASIDDLVPYRRQREVTGQESALAPAPVASFAAGRPAHAAAPMASTNNDDRSLGSNGSNYRRKGRSMSINPFTLTPQEMTDYFDGKITYNPYKDELRKKREEAARKEKHDREMRERREDIRRRESYSTGSKEVYRPSSALSLQSEDTSSLASSATSVSSAVANNTRPKAQRRLSQDLGKTLGVPYFQSVGIKPIRSSISDFADSGQHLMYLRVVTEDDPVDVRPTSLVKIGLDREIERNNLKNERQSLEYKTIKAALLDDNPKAKLSTDAQGKVRTVPDTFWKNWDLRVSICCYLFL